MRKILLLLLIFTTTFVSSCKESKKEIKKERLNLYNIPKDWIKLTEKNNKLVVFNSCDSGNLMLKILKKEDQFEIILHGEQEDSSFQVIEVSQLKDTLFINAKLYDSDTEQVFKFNWIDKQKGIGRWKTKYADGFVSDFTFVTDEKQKNFDKIDQPCRECWGDECDEIEKITKQKAKPIAVIKKIFDDYVQYSESTDSPESKDLMSKTIKSIDKITAAEDFEILINVWMYYDPTDFPSRDLVFSVLEKNKVESIKAIKARIKNKKDWETSDSAPLSELNYLINKLEK